MGNNMNYSILMLNIELERAEELYSTDKLSLLHSYIISLMSDKEYSKALLEWKQGLKEENLTDYLFDNCLTLSDTVLYKGNI